MMNYWKAVDRALFIPFEITFLVGGCLLIFALSTKKAVVPRADGWMLVLFSCLSLGVTRWGIKNLSSRYLAGLIPLALLISLFVGKWLITTVKIRLQWKYLCCVLLLLCIIGISIGKISRRRDKLKPLCRLAEVLACEMKQIVPIRPLLIDTSKHGRWLLWRAGCDCPQFIPAQGTANNMSQTIIRGLAEARFKYDHVWLLVKKKDGATICRALRDQEEKMIFSRCAECGDYELFRWDNHLPEMGERSRLPIPYELQDRDFFHDDFERCTPIPPDHPFWKILWSDRDYRSFSFSDQWYPYIGWGWQKKFIRKTSINVDQEQPLSGRQSLRFSGPERNGLRTVSFPLPLPAKLAGSVLFRGELGDHFAIFGVTVADNKWYAVLLRRFHCLYGKEVRRGTFEWCPDLSKHIQNAYLVIELCGADIFIDNIRLWTK